MDMIVTGDQGGVSSESAGLDERCVFIDLDVISVSIFIFDYFSFHRQVSSDWTDSA
jgi:hypothetical protein